MVLVIFILMLSFTLSVDLGFCYLHQDLGRGVCKKFESTARAYRQYLVGTMCVIASVLMFVVLLCLHLDSNHRARK